ncbi:MAG: GNAT family N-acetyltransferase [Alphaproteobacteria bacterium]|nr:MAG: GNAT family N-acetyltransferase [Alphaproteobacteria bacterium]
MAITYTLEPDLSAQEFRDVLVSSTLAERRPVDDIARLEKMLRHADIIVTARDGIKLVGIARAVTDFSYCCYLSDLAVDTAYQHKGIGRRLIEETQKAAGPQTGVHLIAAPKAEGYYPKIGMRHVPSCWGYPRAA